MTHLKEGDQAPNFTGLNQDSNSISVNCSEKSILEKENIVYKSIQVMQKLNNGGGIKIDITKNIPIGAGLGGGSSNAASTILVLNRFE